MSDNTVNNAGFYQCLAFGKKVQYLMIIYHRDVLLAETHKFTPILESELWI